MQLIDHFLELLEHLIVRELDNRRDANRNLSLEEDFLQFQWGGAPLH